MEFGHALADVPELRIAIRALAAFQRHPADLQAVAETVQQAVNGALAPGGPFGAQLGGEARGTPTGPTKGTLRIAAGERIRFALQGVRPSLGH